MPLGGAGHPGGGPLFWLLIEIASYRPRRASQLFGTMITRRPGLLDGVVGGVVGVGVVAVGVCWGPAGGCALVGEGRGNGNVDGMTNGGRGMIDVALGRVVGVGCVPVALGVAGGFEVAVGRG